MSRTAPRGLPAGFLARPIAHRGLHRGEAGIVENTRAAFQAAIGGGFGIECDIQRSADGEAMVFHDFELDRLTAGTGRLDAHSAGQLRQIGFRAGRDGIESLGDLFALVAGRVLLVVEIKSRFDGDDRIAARIAELARDYAGPLVFKSFDPAKITALRAAGITQPLGFIGMASYDYPDFAHLAAADKHSLANLLHFSATRPDFLSWNHADLPSAGPFLCRSELGLPVMSWTIRSAEAAARIAPHIDQIVFEGFLPA